jgi:hypothetical protein
MALELILIDAATKEEIGRRPMTSDQERYSLYQACFNRELISFNGNRYKPTPTQTTAGDHLISLWQIPEHNFVVYVMFDSWDPEMYCDD